ncbi:MAG: hypothetical protein EBZ61_10625 [Micrococcales bacterium]|nr:hypothetical protein [Micrococcales bacterium]
MPSKSKAQHNLMEAVAHSPKFAKKVGIPQTVGKEFVSADKKMKKGGPSLAIGRGEKLPADKGAGLTAKGREKYNRETGSNLKAPQPQGGPRRDSFCARMEKRVTREVVLERLCGAGTARVGIDYGNLSVCE